MRQQRTLRMRAPGVLGNDRDTQEDRLTAVRVSEPAHGSLRLNGDGSFTYKPTRQFVGTDSFTYRASDGPLASDPARVTIKVRRLPTCDGRIVMGGPGEDTLLGDPARNVLLGGPGRDRIQGRAAEHRNP